MLKHAKLQNEYWDYTFMVVAVHLYNQNPKKNLNYKSPKESFFKSEYYMLMVYGSKYFPNLCL